MNLINICMNEPSAGDVNTYEKVVMTCRISSNEWRALSENLDMDSIYRKIQQYLDKMSDEIIKNGVKTNIKRCFDIIESKIGYEHIVVEEMSELMSAITNNSNDQIIEEAVDVITASYIYLHFKCGYKNNQLIELCDSYEEAIRNTNIPPQLSEIKDNIMINMPIAIKALMKKVRGKPLSLADIAQIISIFGDAYAIVYYLRNKKLDTSKYVTQCILNKTRSAIANFDTYGKLYRS